MVLKAWLTQGSLERLTRLLIGSSLLFSVSNCQAGDDDAPVLVAPNGIVRLPDDGLLISDIESHRILRWHASTGLTFWGGTGQPGHAGDGGHVSQATFSAPSDLKLDASRSSLLIADSNNHRIRKVDLHTLKTTTVAGTGRAELSGDDGPAAEAGLDNPQGLAVDTDGNMLVADTYNHVIRRIAVNGTITTVAGSTGGLSGDGGRATLAQLSLPMAVAFDCDQRSFYISDAGNNRIRRVSADGIIQTICGVGKGSDDAGAGFAGDGELASKAKIFSALDLAVLSPNFFYLSDSGNHRIRAVAHGIIFSIVGNGHPSGAGVANSEKNNSSASPFVPAKIAPGPDGSLYFCDRGNRSIRLLTKDGKIETLPLCLQASRQ